MPQNGHGENAQDVLQLAHERVREFLATAEQLSPEQLASLSREQRRARSRLDTDPDFLQVVCAGAWTPLHADAARLIKTQARSTAETLVPWLRRAALATALEEAALVVFNEADPRHPLPPTLCNRLSAPWDRAIGSLLAAEARPAHG